MDPRPGRVFFLKNKGSGALPLSYISRSFISHFKMGLAKLSKLALNLWSYCLSLLTSWNDRGVPLCQTLGAFVKTLLRPSSF